MYSTGPSFWHGKTGRPWSLPVCYVRKCGSALFVKVLDPFVPLGIVDVDGSALAQQRHGIVLGVVQEVGLIVALKMLGVIDHELGMVPHNLIAIAVIFLVHIGSPLVVRILCTLLYSTLPKDAR